MNPGTLIVAMVVMEQDGKILLRSPFVAQMVTIFRHQPALLPIASFHTLSEEERWHERP